MFKLNLFYSIKLEPGLFLQGVEINENFKRGAVAPTMGNRHTYTEFKTVWGQKEVFFEPLTLAGYIKILLEEYRWETRKPKSFEVLPKHRKSIDEE